MDKDIDYFKNIDKIYKKATYFQRHGLDVFFTIIIIIFILSLIVYFTILNSLQKLRANWDVEKCNPMYMPFASIINPDPNKTSEQQVEDNINYCIKNQIKDTSSSATKAFYNKLELFTELKNNFFKSMAFITSLFTTLFYALQKVMAEIIETINRFILGISSIFIKIRSTLYQIIGIMAVNINIFEELILIAGAWFLNIATFTTVSVLVPVTAAWGGALVVMIFLFVLSSFPWFFWLKPNSFLATLIWAGLGVVVLATSIVCLLMLIIQGSVHKHLKNYTRSYTTSHSIKNVSSIDTDVGNLENETKSENL